MTQTRITPINSYSTEASKTQETLRVLHVDASSRGPDSVTRQLGAQFIADLQQQHGNVQVTRRDTTIGLPLIDAAWVAANFTPAEQRTKEHQNVLALSDTLVEELQQTDVLLIGSPIYNFSVPAALKAWIDQVARAGLTFRYTANGPQGLLKNKKGSKIKAYIIVASGGTPIGSEVDFASGYLRHVLGFLGISDVTLIPAERLNANRDGAMEKVQQTIRDSIQALRAELTQAA